MPRRDDDFEDRPRRREDYDERPRRRDGYDDRSMPRDRPKGLSVLGLVTLIGGIVTLLGSFIPCIGAFAIFGGVVGVLLSGVALKVAGTSNHGKGLPVAGLIVNGLCILVAGVWIIVIAAFSTLKPTTSTSMTDSDAEPVRITAGQLCREFNSNVLKAEEDYKGKTVEVTGQVKLVSRERLARITVELGSGTDTVDCDFGSASKSDLAGIAVGQTVTVRGRCKGIDRSSKYVVLENCKLVRDDGAKEAAAVKVEAAKLLREYGADETAAEKLYRGKRVEITGTVSDVVDDDRKELVLLFQGENARWFIHCKLTPEATRATKGVKAGQKVTVRGTCSGVDPNSDDVILVENASLVKDE